MCAAKAAGSYQANNKLQEQEGRELIDQLSIKAGQIVLDLGCGTGNLTAMLADKVGPEGWVVGVDPDSERIRIAQETYGHVANLSFAVGSSEEFPNLGEPVYDAIFSNCVFTHIKDKRKAFENCFSSLKTGRGKIAISYLDRYPDQFNELITIINPINLEYLQHFWLFEPQQSFEMYCKDAGFKIDHESSTVVACQMLYADIEELCRVVSAAMHGALDMKEATPEKLRKFRTGVGVDGKILYEYSAFQLIAFKE